MTRANRDFRDGHPSSHPTIDGFVGGSNAQELGGIVRSVDGHYPYEAGIDGSNVHVYGSDTDPQWDDPIGVTVECDD